MKSYDIVGYTFNADQYCPEHIVEQLDGQAPVVGSEAESKLDYIAGMLGIDRQDEHSYDSGDFPKVIFADSVHDGCSADNGYEPGQCGDRCGACGEFLGDDCPNCETLPDEYVTAFIQGYAACMLWANTIVYNPETHEPTDDSVEPEWWQDGSDMWALDAFGADSQASIREDCESFISGNVEDLRNLDAGQAGHDFALTRNGHGAGFWDRGLGEVGERLTAASKPYGSSTASMPSDGDGACVTLDSL